MRAQASFERRVLERGHRLEATHLPVHGGGHADRGAGEVMMPSGRLAFADAPKPSRGVAAAPAQHRFRQRPGVILV